MNKVKDMLKKGTALMIITVMIFSTILPVAAKASEEKENSNPEQFSTELNESTEIVDDVDSASQDEKMDVVQEKSPEKSVENETAKRESQDNIVSQTAEEADELEYVYIEKPYVQSTETQNIVVSFTTLHEMDRAILTCKNEYTNSMVEIEATEIEEGTVLFSKEYDDVSQNGTYLLNSIRVIEGGREREVVFLQQGIEGKYGVNVECITNPDQIIEQIDETEQEQKLGISVQSMSEDGVLQEEGSMSEAIETAIETGQADSMANARGVSTRATKNPIVIVLDPGHDNNHAGAQANGLAEEKLTMKIAKYCQEELQTYYGAQVYLTRTGGECPSATGNVAGHKEKDEVVCLKNRADYAANKKADVFISFHLNSFSNPAAKGAEVYYASSSSNAGAQNQSVQMAEKIAAQLKNLGLTLRNNANGTNTANFSVLRNSIAKGIPAVLIEHCFISNPAEAGQYLGSDAKLRKLGLADALGIAKHLGLAKGEWVQNSTGWWFRYADGSYPKSCWAYLGGEWYHFDSKGYREYGFITVGDKKYYLDSDGIMQTGWVEIDGDWFFFSDSGAMQTGWLQRGSNWYYLNTEQNQYGVEGIMRTGWLQRGSNWYFLNTEQNQYGAAGIMRTGWLQRGSNWYYMNLQKNEKGSQGIMLKGWQKVNGKWYYLNPQQNESGSEGVMRVGWLTVDGKVYYLSSSGAMLTGVQVIDNVEYDFGTSGAVSFGWKEQAGNWYYYTLEGKLLKGWIKEEGKIYFSDNNGVRSEGWKQIEKEWYFFDSVGVMQSGWLKRGTNWYYLNPLETKGLKQGAMLKGWQLVDGIKYYLNPEQNSDGAEGIMRTGWLQIGETWFFLNTEGNIYGPKGSMVQGWLQRGTNKYYLSSEGKMLTEWQEIDGDKYYFKLGGQMLFGEQIIDGKQYVFDQEGRLLSSDDNSFQDGLKKIDGKYYYFLNNKMQTGWQNIKEAWHYFNESGIMQTGWLQRGSNWYFLNTEQNQFGMIGVMRTGWLQRGSNWYFLNTEVNQYGAEGKMRTGWLQRGNNKYFLNAEQNQYGAEGVMAKGWRNLANQWYYFNSNRASEGCLRYTGVTSIMGRTGVTTQQMVKQYMRSGRTYPSVELKKGGAASISDFCNIIIDEAQMEGVKAEVVFSQAMLETGYLQFGGDVKISQFNFAGLGATGNGVTGERFKDVRQGIRAQVQHLKAYASTEKLKNPKVDNRFDFVKRNSAPYVEWLGIQENPAPRTGWAAGINYGFNLVEIYMKSLYN